MFKKFLVGLAVVAVIAACVAPAVIFYPRRSTDSGPTKVTVAKVHGKEIVPAYTTTQRSMIKIGPFRPSSTTHHPESYRLKYILKNKEYTFPVDKASFDGVQNGAEVQVIYTTDQWGGSLQPIKVVLK